MEYVDGTTLSDARSQKRSKCFGIPELVPWITSLCDALAYAHETAGVIHRDLRPANILVDSRAKLKITNFGIACSLRNSMRRVSGQTAHGTLNYMSPQQLLGRGSRAFGRHLCARRHLVRNAFEQTALLQRRRGVAGARGGRAPNRPTPRDPGNRGRANSEALGGNDRRLSGEKSRATAAKRSRGGAAVAARRHDSLNDRERHRQTGFRALRQTRRAGRRRGCAGRRCRYC